MVIVYDLGKAKDEEQIRCINLAKRGMLALHPEWYACGEVEGAAYRHYDIAFLDVIGIRGVSLFYLAMKRALDVLMLNPRTDPERVAMTGLSGGGWQTAVLSALDERIKLTVPVAGHSGVKPRITVMGDLGDLETGALRLAYRWRLCPPDGFVCAETGPAYLQPARQLLFPSGKCVAGNL